MSFDPTIRDSRGRVVATSAVAAGNFTTWFGESKAVDAEGRPLVVFHGTDRVFSEFGYGYDNAQYFSSDPEIASDYSIYHSRSENPFPNVIPCYVSVKNPMVISRSDLEEMLEWDGEIDWTYMEQIVEDARKRGYDGLFLKGVLDYKNNPDGPRIEVVQDQWVTFEPNQIKSAIGNRGTFNPSSSCITDGHYCFTDLKNANDDLMSQAERAREYISSMDSPCGSPTP